MDRSTVIGLAGAMGVVFFAIQNEFGTDVGILFRGSTIAMVFLGSAFCAMISVRGSTFVGAYQILKKAVFHTEPNLADVVQRLEGYARLARRETPVELDNQLKGSDENPFFIKGLQMALDGMTAAEVETAMRVEIHGLRARHRAGKQLFIVMGKYAPAFGLLTTIIGEIKMFTGLGGGVVSIPVIGEGMAFALVGTMYGVIIANLFCLPIADKLETRAHEEILLRELYIQSVISIATEASPTALRQNLLAFLDQRTADRVAMEG